jgi:hypothetical protein
MKKTRQKKRRTRRIRLTKKYKAGGGPLDWLKKGNENKNLSVLKLELEEKNSKLSYLINSINFDQNLDWVMDLTVEKGKTLVNNGYFYDEEGEHIYTNIAVDCLKITNVQYDKNKLLPKIFEFFKLREEISKLEELPRSIDEDSVLLLMIQFIVEQFVKLHAAHNSEKIFHKYIQFVLNKVPPEWKNIPFEEKKPKEYINYLTPPIIPNVQTPGTEQIRASFIDINKFLPEKFKYEYEVIQKKLNEELG